MTRIIKKYIILLGLLLLPQMAGGADPFNSISGVVTNPDGSPCVNCTVTFTPNGQTPQICNGTTVYPKTVFTTTDANGNVSPISVYQGVPMIVTITDANGNISAQQPVPIPFTTGTTISQLLAMNLLQTQTVQVNGFSTGTTYVTSSQSPYTIPITGFMTVCDASSGPVAINLPPTSGGGRWLEFKKIDNSPNACTINPSGGDVIDGLTSYALTLQYAGMYLKDGVAGKWTVLAPIRQQYVGQDYGGGSLTTVQNIIARPQATAQPAALIGYQSAGTYDPIGFNAKMDGAICSDITVTNNSAVLSSLGCANFTGRAGELIAIIDPNGNRLLDTTIATVQSSVQITLTNTYTGTTYTGNAQVVWGNDDGAVMNQFINSQPQNSTFTIQFPPGRIMTVGTPISYNGRNVRILGSGSWVGGGVGTGAAPGLGTSGASATGSLVVPIFTSAPNPAAVFYVVDTWGGELGNMSIAGDNLYANNTTKLAAVTTIRKANPGDDWPSTFPYFHDLSIGNLTSTPLGGNPAVYYGFDLMGSGAQNDRGTISRSIISSAVTGFAFCPDIAHPAACQAFSWHVEHVTCNRDAVCWDQSHGGVINSVDQMQDLSSGLDFYLGDTAYLSVTHFNAEHTGNRLTFATPWSAATLYPRNFAIMASDGSMWQQSNTGGAQGTTGAVQPGCLVNTSLGTTCVDNTITWTQTGTPLSASGGPVSMFAIGLGTGGQAAGQIIATKSTYDINSWLPPYGTPANALVSADGGDFTYSGTDDEFLPSQLNPATGLTPVIDLTALGVQNRTLSCQTCTGLGLFGGATSPGNTIGIFVKTFSGDTRQITRINVSRPSGWPHLTVGDLGERINEYLINGAAPSNAEQAIGPFTNWGGPTTVSALAPPIAILGLSCSNPGGANTYKYKATAVSGTGETLGSAEATLTCNGAIGVAGVTAQGIISFPVLGATNYKVYRTAAGGGSNTETFDLSFAAGQATVFSLGNNSFLDSATDASISGNPGLPTGNTTGQLSVGGMETVPLIQFSTPLPTPGASPTALLGTTGSGTSGPAAAAQNSWLQIKDQNGNTAWIPVWK